MSSHKELDDISTKFQIIRSYWDVTGLVIWSFLATRVATLPLESFHRQLPAEGTIVEVGCGHGVVLQYLARRGCGRKVVGYEPDGRRIPIAQAAAKAVPNLEWRPGYFEKGLHDDLTAVVIIGVLCLLDDATCMRILSAARASLPSGNILLLSDILKNDNDWRYGFHVWRERLFARIGFTQGQGLFLRSPEVWKELIHNAGFRQFEPFTAPVPLHSVFNWVCK